MKNKFTKIIILIALLVVGLLAWFVSNQIRRSNEAKLQNSPAAKSQVQGMVSSNSEGGIEVVATLIDSANKDEETKDILEKYPSESNTIVKIQLTTHSGDLSSFDMASASSITDASNQSLKAASWVNTNPDSHHREGFLIFPKINQPQALKINGLGGVGERILNWK